MRYERTYFHEAAQHTGRCPADEGLGVHEAFSPWVQAWAVRLAALMPYAQAEQLLDELAEVSISDSAIWRSVQAAGQQANTHLTAQAEQHTALPDPDQISPGIAPTAPP